jgi:polysaccharide export outer membrane protein
MSRLLVRLAAGIAAFVVALVPGVSLRAQQRPTADEARALLESRPDLVAQLRAKLLASGLTPDQVRARLRAEGYPEDLLDPYLPGGMATGADSIPGPAVFDAIRALGVMDSLEIDSLRGGSRLDMLARQLGQVRGEQVVCDSVVGVPADSTDSLGVDSLVLDSAGNRVRRRRLVPQLVCRPFVRLAVTPPDSGFAIFGLDLFSNPTSQFEPNLAGPVDENYRLGPGDRLVLILTGDVEISHILDVTREGFIVIPQVGQLSVANLTLAQLEDLLYARLGRVYSGIRRGPGATTHFSISVARLRTNQVFVTGDVVQPGSYRVSSAGTALTALYAAGGPTENGSLRRVEIRRGGRLVDVLDVYDYILHGDASHDPRLESGDIVFVPVHGPRVRVVGEVMRPATYELKDGETLADLIRAAGGYKPTASRSRVQIERILPPEERRPGGRDRVVMDVSLAGEAADGGAGAGNDGQNASRDGGQVAPALPLMAGDVVRVFPIAKRVRDRISVLGDVWLPGWQGFTPGMRLSDAIKGAGGIKPDAYLGQILISRLKSDSTRVQLRSSFRDSTGAVAADISLEEDDEIRVFSVAEFRPLRYVSISGAVRRSGRVPYREGMTLRDLVLLAGGLEEGAYLNEAEIARLPENRAAGVLAKTIRVPLDSSYLFERGPNGEYLGPPGLPAPRGPAPEVRLEPYDNVLILRQPNWQLPQTVVVTGEVKFPGHYTLLSKDERLSDVIERAGGFTASAYPDGVVFYRKQGHLGRIGVDLPAVMKDPRFRDNLILQDGDSIYIPAYSGVVNVAGAVNSPLAVAYVPGKDLDYYVSAAGGPSRRADMRRAYVRQPNGKVESVHRHLLWFDGVPEPGPGSYVFVPEKETAGQSTWAQNLPVVASILGSLVAVVALIRR